MKGKQTMSNNVFVNDKLTMASTQSDKSLKRLEVFLRPTEKNEFFRFRLLWFKSENSNRKVPYIERWVHQVWEDGADGKRILNEMICPISKHVAENWPGNPYDDCPICQFSNMNFVAFKDSGYTDKQAGTNSKTFKRKYDLVVPVYIVSDPCYSGNVGKIRVFRINDSKVGETFKKLIVNQSSKEGMSIFNGGKGVDFLIRMDKVKHDLDNGTSYTKNEIVQMGFSSKAYEIKAITPELIDAFPFDDYFGAVPTMSDLKDFYKKHCLHATTDDIDFDGLSDMRVNAEPVKPVESAKSTTEDFADEVADFEEEGLTEGAGVGAGQDSDEDPLSGIPDEMRGEEADIPEVTPVTSGQKKNTPVDTQNVDVDNILKSVGLDGIGTI